MNTLLVIDDDPFVLRAITLALSGEGIRVVTAASAAAGVVEFTRDRPCAVVCDVRLPDTSGLDLIAQLRELDPSVPVVLTTGHGTAETAIEAMRRGAFDYALKPLDPDALLDVVERAFEVGRLMRVPALVADDDNGGGTADRFVGQSPAMQEVFKAIGRTAPTDATVLILGESGSGKEMVARSVYHYSRRAGKQFQALNCAAIPETLLESDLFGHERGAFTGADRRRIGKFEQCHGGTLFLDEIGDMSLLTQAKILRVLQEQQFERVGGSETVRTDVRLIAATHRDLATMIAAGKFREDLYYRLNVCTIRIPPLRERAEDIPELAEYFVRRFAPEFGKHVRGLFPEVVELLKGYSWPGNVRELQSCVKQAIVRATHGSVLVPDNLPDSLRPGQPAAPAPAAADNGAVGGEPFGGVHEFIRRRLGEGTTDLHAELLAVVEKQLLAEVLVHTRNNLSLAARVLGITRPTIRSKLALYGLEAGRIPPVRAAGSDRAAPAG
jgi:two-component system nitrogen regulation response regulator GlnG